MKWTHVYPWLVAAALGSCTGTGQVEYSGQVAITSPDLIEVQPGVQVVADADQPLFFVDGSYYLYRDGFWLRSARYDSGFVRIDVVPERLRVIGDAHAYVHYRRSHPVPMEARQQRLTPEEARERNERTRMRLEDQQAREHQELREQQQRQDQREQQQRRDEEKRDKKDRDKKDRDER